MAERDERLWSLLEPSTTAVLTMELQNGIVGAGGMLPALLEELPRGHARHRPPGLRRGTRCRRARGALHRGVTRRRRGCQQQLQDLRPRRAPAP